MPITTICHPGDFVSREVRHEGQSQPKAGRAGHPETRRAPPNRDLYGESPAPSSERAKAARIFADAKRRAAKRDATHARASAMIEARAEVASVGYVPEDGREDVVRIMVERGLSVDDAFEAWAAASPSMPVASRGGRIGGQ